jgi:simple sugar transport system permease protein
LTALAALLLFNLLFTEGFARVTVRDGHLYGSLVDILKLSSRVMLVSLGMTLVIATAGVDLSVGAVMAIAGSVAAKLLEQYHAGLPAVIVATLGACLLLGAWNGALVAWFGVQPIVATLILMVAGRGIANRHQIDHLEWPALIGCALGLGKRKQLRRKTPGSDRCAVHPLQLGAHVR